MIPRTAAITRAVISNFQAIERAELSIAVGEVVIPDRPAAADPAHRPVLEGAAR